MAARYVSSQLIKNVSKGGRTLTIEYVDKTTAWVRPSDFPSSSVKQDFTEVVQENMDTFSPETTKVAMKESEHQSEKDKRVHYTAFALDKNGEVIETKHLVRHK
ncbi:hypothetical protein J7T55_014953 [Diaporthe amygdali]|uniref:uncharacterized protein n=1 Tax=Phomopsis amygdali TaxID=1214568 RepID=UPI0022FE3093|nr:uncharacterized protein J7T55_014953 [Diaporthe amygdali]KAJ0106877.1 hypothetical protein J7T55_014953 [Diaporthe amygdali]